MSGTVRKLLCAAAFVAVALPAAGQTVPFRDEASAGAPTSAAPAKTKVSERPAAPAAQPQIQAAQPQPSQPQPSQPNAKAAAAAPSVASPAAQPPGEPIPTVQAARPPAPAQKLQAPAAPAPAAVAAEPVPQPAMSEGRPRGNARQRPEERRIVLTALANGWPLTEATPYWK